MVSVRMLLIAVVGALGLASGCEKQIQVTIYNHSDEAKTIRVTTPEETTTVGIFSMKCCRKIATFSWAENRRR